MILREVDVQAAGNLELTLALPLADKVTKALWRQARFTSRASIVYGFSPNLYEKVAAACLLEMHFAFKVLIENLLPKNA
eukprot:751878-Hanusia_phi.AAC.2